jgi:hypothetical protein
LIKAAQPKPVITEPTISTAAYENVLATVLGKKPELAPKLGVSQLAAKVIENTS